MLSSRIIAPKGFVDLYIYGGIMNDAFYTFEEGKWARLKCERWIQFILRIYPYT